MDNPIERKQSFKYTPSQEDILKAAAPDLLKACIKCMSIFLELAEQGRYPDMLLQQNGGEGLQFLSKAIHKATK